MRTRLFSAAVLSALWAATASAQSPPAAPPAAEGGTLPRPVLVIHAEERPEPAPGLFARVGAWWRDPAPTAAPTGTSPAPILAPATPAVTAADPVADAAPGGPGRFWVQNELLLWWIQGQHLPALVSTSPAGTPAATAGVLGVAGNSSIYGPEDVQATLRYGWRFTAGGWLDPDHRYALEAQFLATSSGNGETFTTASPAGGPILARPVANGITGAPTAEPISVPGVSFGGVRVSSSTSGLVGAGLWLRENFTRSDDPCDTCHHCAFGGCGAGGCAGCADHTSPWYCRFDSLFGFRYLRLSDHLEIDDNVTALAALNGIPAGATMQRVDAFRTANSFYGVDLGVTGEIQRGNFSLDLLAKMAVGFNDGSIDILGARNLGGVVTAGGLLAQPTNIGHFTRTTPTAVPELGAKLGYFVRPNIKVFVGYTLLYWYNVLRAGDVPSLYVDPAFLANGAPTGAAPARPGVFFTQRDLWVQGVSIGVEWRY